MNYVRSFFSRLSTRKWLFAILISVVFYLLLMWSSYSDEIDAIRKKSLEHFDGDITPYLGVFEVLKSHGFDYFGSFYKTSFMVFIPNLVIAGYFFEYRNEPHAGWMRVFISAQMLIPPIVMMFIPFSNTNGPFSAAFCIFIWGATESVILIMIKLFTWIRKGFASQVG